MRDKGHSHKGIDTEKKLLLTIVLNFTICAVEVAGGLISGSLSLVSDALHNFSDAIAVLISYIAIKLTALEHSSKKTFGYRRAEVFAAFINALILVVISLFLFEEAIGRLVTPPDIKGGLMLGVAFIGLVANLGAVFLLREESKRNINIRAAFLHLLADSISSAGVIVGALVIIFFGFTLIDPLLTLLIGIIVLKESYQILSRTVRILMQHAPEHIDVYEVKRAVEELPEVKNLHHIHIWQLSEGEIHFEGHLDLNEDLRLSRACTVLEKIEKLLKKKFGITHSTIQIEYNVCKDKSAIRGRKAKD